MTPCHFGGRFPFLQVLLGYWCGPSEGYCAVPETSYWGMVALGKWLHGLMPTRWGPYQLQPFRNGWTYNFVGGAHLGGWCFQCGLIWLTHVDPPRSFHNVIYDLRIFFGLKAPPGFVNYRLLMEERLQYTIWDVQNPFNTRDKHG